MLRLALLILTMFSLEALILAHYARAVTELLLRAFGTETHL